MAESIDDTLVGQSVPEQSDTGHSDVGQPGVEQVDTVQSEAEFLTTEELIARSVEQLQGKSRRGRQEASQVLARLAKEDPESVVACADALVAALEVHEAQTRWQCLEALSDISRIAPASILDAFDGAEGALFEEGSTSMRVAAFRYLTCYGMVSPDHSEKAWPIMAEALQCYHGDPEYRDMLVCLRDFAEADLESGVRNNLFSRMTFDSKHARGLVKAYANEVLSRMDNKAPKGKEKAKSKGKKKGKKKGKEKGEDRG